MDITRYKAILKAVKVAASARHAPAPVTSAAAQIVDLALAVGRLSPDAVGAVSQLLEAADAHDLIPALNAIPRADASTQAHADPELPHLPPDAPAAYAALVQRTAQRRTWRAQNEPQTPSTSPAPPIPPEDRSAHEVWRAPHFAERNSSSDDDGGGDAA